MTTTRIASTKNNPISREPRLITTFVAGKAIQTPAKRGGPARFFTF
jgi:hypothetical protein